MESPARKKESRPSSSAGQEARSARPPVVVVMGHVDHGKTTLLDHIRKTNVAAREAGGITQSIGAYEIEHPSTISGQAPKKITFIDTPGHEAFLKMRARGAHIADVAVLVIAADDGPKPQTLESLKILRDTKTPFIVALTKIDKSGVNLDKAKKDLLAAGILLEGLGGQVPWHAVSGKTGAGVNELLDLVLLAAELEELTADPALPAEGVVLEARRDSRRGNEATVIVTNGTLRQGDEVATSTAHGKVKILENFLGEAAKELVPAAPARIVGFETLPEAGEEFAVGPSVALMAAQKRSAGGAASFSSSPSTEAAARSDKRPIALVLKAENAGSLEALAHVVRGAKLGRPVSIVQSSVGDVTDNDVKLAIPTGAAIVAFGNRVDRAARTLAEANNVPVLHAPVIYHLMQSLEEFSREDGETAPAALEVLAVFGQKKPDRQVVGGKVIEGTFVNRSSFDIERGGAVAGSGRVQNLQQRKADVAHVEEGNEAGLLVVADIAIQKGDKLIVRSQGHAA